MPTRLCFPAVHDLIDWRHPPEFLDTELQQLGPEHSERNLAVDRLVKVRFLDGTIECLYIHVEIQAQRQSHFSRRMWVYHYRILDRFGQTVVSLAVLADDDPSWRPWTYETATAGCRVRFEFPIFKVLDFPDPERVFRRTGNPFALVIAAHQLALATKRNSVSRYEHRFELLKHLSAMGMERQQARELWKVCQMLTRLPRELELQFKAETATVPDMSIDDLVTPLEQYAKEEARQQDVTDVLEARFGTVPEDVCARINQTEDLEQLRQMLRSAATAPNLEQFLASAFPG